MTQPTAIYLGPDGHSKQGGERKPKIYFRTVLFSPGKLGVMVESLCYMMTRNESVQNFNIWIYGDKELVWEADYS